MFGVDVAKQYLVPKGEYCWKYVEALRFIAFYIAYLVAQVGEVGTKHLTTKVFFMNL